MPRKIPEQWVDPKTGKITLEALRYLDDLENGGSGNPNIGTLLSGLNSVTATTTNIVNGTQPLADVLITGRGSVSGQIDANTANTNAAAVAASAGALTASVSPVYAYATSATAGTLITNSVTVTPSGGTGPYTYAWAKFSGDTFTISAPTSATTTFSVTLGSGGFADATYRCTVTDSLAATYSVDVSVTAQVTDML